MAEHKIIPVLPDRIPYVWEHAWPYLENVVRREGDRFDPIEATHNLIEGITQLWIAVDDEDRIVGALCTTIRHDGDYDDKRALDIHGLGGINFNDWAKECAQMMRDWAYVNGCHRIVFQGRKGLRRLHKPLGNVEEYGRDGAEYLYEVKL